VKKKDRGAVRCGAEEFPGYRDLSDASTISIFERVQESEADIYIPDSAGIPNLNWL
jgi:hypothetical protein